MVLTDAIHRLQYMSYRQYFRTEEEKFLLKCFSDRQLGYLDSTIVKAMCEIFIIRDHIAHDEIRSINYDFLTSVLIDYDGQYGDIYEGLMSKIDL